MLSGAAARLDANANGTIDVSEYRHTVSDYTADEITYTELLEVVLAYQVIRSRPAPASPTKRVYGSRRLGAAVLVGGRSRFRASQPSAAHRRALRLER